MSQNYVFRSAALAGLSLLLTGRVVEVQHARRVTSGTHGRFTLEQIVERSMPICGALATNCDSLRLTAIPLCVSARGQLCPVWMVDGVDAQDRFRIHLVWEADTGELMLASRPIDTFTLLNGKRLLNRKQARQFTSSWLTTLGMSELATGWRPDSTPHDIESMWRVEWCASTRTAAVTIDSRTGDLIMAQAMKRASTADRYQIAHGATIAGLHRL